jgi:hypothetical protein
MNWRHGQVYVSASKFQAASFAMAAPEAIDTCRKLDEVLRKQGQESRAQGLLEEHEELARILTAQSHPVVIELQGVPCDALLPEKDKEKDGGLFLRDTPHEVSPCALLHELDAGDAPIEVSGQRACFILNTVWKPEPNAIFSVTQTGPSLFDYSLNRTVTQEDDGIAS